MLTTAERRERFRDHLSRSQCTSLTTVFDPLSARVADCLGRELAIMAGSLASAAVLGAPDLTVITLSELADQARRITRASNLSLLVDGDHGYGNALSVMRTVEELEAAGAAALTVEDTLLPPPFGDWDREQLIPVPEMVGKLRAAVAARSDPSLVIVGRTSAFRSEGLEAAIARVRAYTETGIDAFFLSGVTTREQVEALHAATPLPSILGLIPSAIDDADFLIALGVRAFTRAQIPFHMAVKAIYDAMEHEAAGARPAELGERVASRELMAQVLRNETYTNRQRQFLG